MIKGGHYDLFSLWLPLPFFLAVQNSINNFEDARNYGTAALFIVSKMAGVPYALFAMVVSIGLLFGTINIIKILKIDFLYPIYLMGMILLYHLGEPAFQVYILGNSEIKLDKGANYSVFLVGLVVVCLHSFYIYVMGLVALFLRYANIIEWPNNGKDDDWVKTLIKTHHDL